MKELIDRLRILIVNDDQMSLLLLTTIFQKQLGLINVETASNGLEAYNMVIGGKGYDLIVMDLNMPIMDGFEATSLIKKHFMNTFLQCVDISDEEDGDSSSLNCFINKSPYIVALSSSVMDHELVERFKMVGFDDWF